MYRPGNNPAPSVTATGQPLYCTRMPSALSPLNAAAPPWAPATHHPASMLRGRRLPRHTQPCVHGGPELTTCPAWSVVGQAHVCTRYAAILDFALLHCHGEKGTGYMKLELKCCTPGVTLLMVSRQMGTFRAACRALQRVAQTAAPSPSEHAHAGMQAGRPTALVRAHPQPCVALLERTGRMRMRARGRSPEQPCEGPLPPHIGPRADVWAGAHAPYARLRGWVAPQLDHVVEHAHVGGGEEHQLALRVRRHLLGQPAHRSEKTCERRLGSGQQGARSAGARGQQHSVSEGFSQHYECALGKASLR